jgi:urease accessory protein
MLMTPEATIALLQFSDGLFPAGAYAHSFGLESYVARGIVSDALGVEKILRAYLQGSAGPTDAVAVVNALRATVEGDLHECMRIDALLDAMKPASELRDASRQMGRQTLRVANSLVEHPIVREFARVVFAGDTPGHHSVVFGIAGGAHGWPWYEAAAAYLYSTTAAIVGASLRLLPLGQLKGQLIIRNLAPLITELGHDATEKNIGELSGFAPGLEIASMRHAAMDARLFRS